MRLKYKSILILLYSCNMINKVKVNKPGSRTRNIVSSGRGLKLSSWQLFTSCWPRHGSTHQNRLMLEPRDVRIRKIWNLRTAPHGPHQHQKNYESIELHRIKKKFTASPHRIASHPVFGAPARTNSHPVLKWQKSYAPQQCWASIKIKILLIWIMSIFLHLYDSKLYFFLQWSVW